MKTMASIKGQPIHSMLMVIPAGAFALVLVFDLLYLLGAGDIWWIATEPLIIAGIGGGILAAIPGAVDLFTSIRSDKAINVATGHVIAAFILLVAFTINLMARQGAAPGEAPGAVWWSVIGFALMLITAWLGGRLVYNHGVGIDVSILEKESTTHKTNVGKQTRRGRKIEELESPA